MEFKSQFILPNLQSYTEYKITFINSEARSKIFKMFMTSEGGNFLFVFLLLVIYVYMLHIYCKSAIQDKKFGIKCYNKQH